MNAAAAAMVLAFAGGPADTGVRVAPLTVEGELPDHLRAALATGLRSALERSSLDVVDEDADRTVRASVTTRGPDLHLAVELVEARTDNVVARVASRCDMCGTAEATEMIASLATALSRRVELQTRAPPTLEVVSDPPGATVMLDGVAVGTTPLELPASAGRHELRIVRRGFVEQTRAIELVDGVTESLAITLSPVVGSPRRPIRWALGWAGVGVGAATTIGGAALIGINGRPIRNKCAGGNVDGDGTCRWNHSTMIPGVVLGTIGIGLLATGVSLIVIEKRRSVGPGLRALLERTPAFARARALARR